MTKRYLVSLFLVICLALLCSEIVIRGYVMTYHRLAQQVYTILNEDKAGVIIGDSHTKAAFTNLPENFANLSVEGMNVLMFDSVVRSYASRNRIEKIIILASPHIFSQYRIDGNVGIYASLPVRALDWRDDIYVFNNVYQAALHDTVKWKILNVLQAKNPIGLLKTRVMQALHLSPPRVKAEEQRRGRVLWAEQSMSQKTEKTVRQLRDHAPAEDFQNHMFAIRYKEMISNLMNSGAQICLVRPPVSEIYNRIYADKFSMAPMERFFEGIVKDEGRGGHIKYVDYRDLGISFADDVLINTDHLNEQGAQIYTPAIMKACFG
ncbi:MAG: hypothetical protein COB36_05635 [Alphaproteobacteria bacterium]|nr:MAG: hypothetical protein COB36_05635 [Alphaproteobacteria bacterium]